MDFVNTILNLIIKLGYLILIPFTFLFTYIKKTIQQIPSLSRDLPKKFKLPMFKRKKGSSKRKVSKYVFLKKIKPFLIDFFKNLKKGLGLLIKDLVKPFVKLKKFLKNIARFLLGVLFAIFCIFVPYEIYKWFKELPNPDMLVLNTFTRSTKIYDRNDRLLYEIYIDKNYEPVNLGRIPQHVIDSTLAVEDDQFFEHSGLRLESIIRAAKETLLKDNLQGGSTITQQLVKNVLLTPERTLSRKVKEAVLSLMVETKYSKNQILEMYLNNIPYGGNAWGIQSASNKYL